MVPVVISVREGWGWGGSGWCFECIGAAGGYLLEGFNPLFHPHLSLSHSPSLSQSPSNSSIHREEQEERIKDPVLLSHVAAAAPAFAVSALHLKLARWGHCICSGGHLWQHFYSLYDTETEREREGERQNQKKGGVERGLRGGGGDL